MDMNGGELLVILVVALLIVGPERLPGYVSQFRDVVRRIRGFLRDAEKTVRSEVGDADLSALDPRQYDPRRIVRDVMREDLPAGRAAGAAAGAAAGCGVVEADAATEELGLGPRVKTRPAGARAPFDTDAT